LTKEGGKYLTQDYLRNFELTLEFKPKKDNVIGTQLADLIAYPISQSILFPEKENKPFNIIRQKVQRGEGWAYGLKTYP
jgi:hypothetical protein